MDKNKSRIATSQSKSVTPVQEEPIDMETRSTHDDHQDLRLWLRLLSCTTKIENQLRTRLRQDFDSTLPRFDLMAQLERNPRGLRMTALSGRLMVSCGNITGITDQLEREGLVVRTPDPIDRRVIIVKLTSAGLKRFRVIARSHEQWIIELFAGMTPEEKQKIFTLLQKLKQHLTASTGPNPTSTNGSGSH
jgi:DNA-binding MarR family transcriptional regulator